MRERNSRDRMRLSSYRKEAERDEVDALSEKAEELREVATDFIKAWEDLHDITHNLDTDGGPFLNRIATKRADKSI